MFLDEGMHANRMNYFGNLNQCLIGTATEDVDT
jgi:hypothetical protein